MSEHAAEFLERFFQLFFSSFLTNIAVGVLCGLIGLFIVLRRMIFVSAALSQVAGAGLAFAFLIGVMMAPHHGEAGPPARVEEQLDRGHVDEEAEEIRDILQDEFPDIGDEFPDPESENGNSKGEEAKSGEGEKSVTEKQDDIGFGAEVENENAPAAKDTTELKPFQIPPSLIAILITVLVSLILAGRAASTKQEKTKEETVVGLLFILGSALAVVFATKADKAAHEIQDVLFGVAVLVPQDQQHLVAVMGLIVLAVYVLMFKDFVFAAFDPTAAVVSGFPTGRANAVLFILIAVVISVCTRAVGAMPVFALTVLPATAALLFHDRIVPAAITSAVLGGLSAGAGYFATGLWELPVGPCIALAATIPLIIATSVIRCRRWIVVRDERKSNP